MTIRFFSKKQGLYTNSSSWPSNQRTWSEWSLIPDGQILEIVYDGTAGYDSGPISCQYHDARNFSVEPWTGYFDKHGKKIYRGDILNLHCFDLSYEVVWSFDRFSLKALYHGHEGEIYPWPHSKDCSENYRVVGNIHGIEYND